MAVSKRAAPDMIYWLTDDGELAPGDMFQDQKIGGQVHRGTDDGHITTLQCITRHPAKGGDVSKRE